MKQTSNSSEPDPVRNYLSQIGKKGGQAGTGKSKARDSEKMRAAVNKRWEKHRKKKAKDEKAKQTPKKAARQKGSSAS